MTATQTSTIAPAYQVGDWVQFERNGVTTTGRITSIHRRKDNGVEYVISLITPDGGLGTVLNTRTTTGQPSLLRPARTSGAPR